ncbi:MAG: 4Fe-4S binding protein [Promethearchaeota archaeon]
MTKSSIIAKLDIKNCIGCGACVEICPKHAIPYSVIGFISSLAKIDANLCDGCGKCVDICSHNALVMFKRDC